MTTKTSTKEDDGTIPANDLKRISIPIVGDSQLISHRPYGNNGGCLRWTDDGQLHIGPPRIPTKSRTPEEQFRDSLYPMLDGDGWGYPATAFECAAARSCKYVDGIDAKGCVDAIMVCGYLVKIDGPDPVMRTDVFEDRKTHTKHFCYRAEFRDWRAVLDVEYDSNVFSGSQIVKLFTLAGYRIGVGEWRIEKGGVFGRFHVPAGKH